MHGGNQQGKKMGGGGGGCIDILETAFPVRLSPRETERGMSRNTASVGPSCARPSGTQFHAPVKLRSTTLATPQGPSNPCLCSGGSRPCGHPISVSPSQAQTPSQAQHRSQIPSPKPKAPKRECYVCNEAINPIDPTVLCRLGTCDVCRGDLWRTDTPPTFQFTGLPHQLCELARAP